ncbi:hypothetical protein Tco_0317461 [Tanacetum coccineum]
MLESWRCRACGVLRPVDEERGVGCAEYLTGGVMGCVRGRRLGAMRGTVLGSVLGVKEEGVKGFMGRPGGKQLDKRGVWRSMGAVCGQRRLGRVMGGLEREFWGGFERGELGWGAGVGGVVLCRPDVGCGEGLAVTRGVWREVLGDRGVDWLSRCWVQ